MDKVTDTVTKKDLVSAVAERCNCQQNTAYDAVQTFLDTITIALSQGKRIELRDFGVFEPRRRDGHSARNPRTKAIVTVPARVSVKFKIGRAMREKVQALANQQSA